MKEKTNGIICLISIQKVTDLWEFIQYICTDTKYQLQ